MERVFVVVIASDCDRNHQDRCIQIPRRTREQVCDCEERTWPWLRGDRMATVVHALKEYEVLETAVVVPVSAYSHEGFLELQRAISALYASRGPTQYSVKDWMAVRHPSQWRDYPVFSQRTESEASHGVIVNCTRSAGSSTRLTNTEMVKEHRNHSLEFGTVLHLLLLQGTVRDHCSSRLSH